MKKYLTHIGIVALTLLVLDYLLVDIKVGGVTAAILGAVILGVLNVIVRPVLLILSLPITILTLGLFILVVNAFTFALAVYFVPGIVVSSFWAALVGSIAISVISTLTTKLS